MRDILQKREAPLNFLESLMARQIISLIIRATPDAEPEISSWRTNYGDLLFVHGVFSVMPNLPIKEVGQPRISVVMKLPDEDCVSVEFEYCYVDANDVWSKPSFGAPGNTKVKISRGAIGEIVYQ